jgi:hypothetical protein
METAVTTPAHRAAAAFPLLDVEDLHDADLYGVLADRLLDAGVAVAAAIAVADLVRGPGQAPFAHTLTARALALAVH